MSPDHFVNQRAQTEVLTFLFLLANFRKQPVFSGDIWNMITGFTCLFYFCSQQTGISSKYDLPNVDYEMTCLGVAGSLLLRRHIHRGPPWGSPRCHAAWKWIVFPAWGKNMKFCQAWIKKRRKESGVVALWWLQLSTVYVPARFCLHVHREPLLGEGWKRHGFQGWESRRSSTPPPLPQLSPSRISNRRFKTQDARFWQVGNPKRKDWAGLGTSILYCIIFCNFWTRGGKCSLYSCRCALDRYRVVTLNHWIVTPIPKNNKCGRHLLQYIDP